MLRQLTVEKRHGIQLADVKRQAEANGGLRFNLQNIAVRQDHWHRWLYLFGVDPHGFSVAVKVEDFHPSFLVKVPDHWSADEEEAEEELCDLVDSIHESRKNCIHNATLVERMPTIGFSNRRQDRLIKLELRGIGDLRAVVKLLQEDRYTLYHHEDGFGPAQQFLHQTQIAYQQWVEVSPVRWLSASVGTHCNMELSCEMGSIRRMEDDTSPPITLKCAWRSIAISRDGLVKKELLYHPDPARPFDRTVALAVSYTWSDQSSPCVEEVHTLLPVDSHPSVPDRPCEFRVYGSESLLHQGFQDRFVSWDPDDLFYFPDVIPTLTYWLKRAGTFNKIDRFKDQPVRTLMGDVSLPTRNVFNMEEAAHKKVGISVESYDLYTLSCHNRFRKKPEVLQSLIREHPNRLMVGGVASRRRLLEKILQELRLLQLLEADTGMRMEFANISKTADTPLSDAVNGGQQVRVMNKLCHTILDEGQYLNREKLGERPLTFRLTERPPTYREPEEPSVNSELRAQCCAELEEKLRYHQKARKGRVNQLVQQVFAKKKKQNLTAEDAQHALDEEEAEGGNVMQPSPRFWDDVRVFVDDFASLYPSIIMGFSISYENLVYDREYLDLPGVEYINILINKYETVVLAVQPGALPKMLRKFVDNRAAVKKKMNSETDPFRQKMLDAEQNSCKVLCNGTYGFLGVRKGGKLSVPTMMFMVTSLGRYLQKLCAWYAANRYEIRTIYGDSVTADTPVLVKRPDGWIEYRAIDDLVRDGSAWSDHHGDKQWALPSDPGLLIWTDDGWTMIRRVIRHWNHKEIVRVLSHTGVVDVTADHSLLLPDGRETTAREIGIGTELMHANLPRVSSSSRGHSSHDTTSPGDGKKQVPSWILNAPLKLKRAFYEGYCAGGGSAGHGKLGAAGLMLLLSSLGLSASVDTADDGNSYRLSVTELPERPNAVKRMTKLGVLRGYVYDLETENHHFAAGVGRMVVHNTDSIFTILPAVPRQDTDPIDSVCWALGGRFKMPENFTWDWVVRHYAERKKEPLDITGFDRCGQLNAILYLINSKLADEMSAMIGKPPIQLTSENMMFPLWMENKKKHYAATLWKESDPSRTGKAKVTGLPSKKREYAPFVRDLLTGIQDLILAQRLSEIRPYLERHLDDLIHNRVPIDRLTITKGYKSKQTYKSFRSIHLQVVLKLEQRTRWPVKENTRIPLVVVKGTDLQYLRGETPEYAIEHGLELDIRFFLQDQIYRPVKKLLAFHPELFNWEEVYQTYRRRLDMMEQGLTSVTGTMGGHRIVTLSELAAKRPKRCPMAVQERPKSIPFPFASLLKKS